VLQQAPENFPIICLSDQIEIVNNFITSNHRTLEEILDWFSEYGELILSDEEHSIRQFTLSVWSVALTRQMNVYILLSWFGFINAFHFDSNNQVIILHLRLAFSYDSKK
jgi:hypothetical protein